MITTPTISALSPAQSWRESVWPKEHGSWSLAFEPVALGLLCAPSTAGAFLALAVAAGFFARRPLRNAWCEVSAERRGHAQEALAGCATLAVLGLIAALTIAGTEWFTSLLPTVALGVVFAGYD